jgi:hypothetical protein
MEYHFLFTPFLFTPNFSRTQLGRKTRAGYMFLEHLYLCLSANVELKILIPYGGTQGEKFTFSYRHKDGRKDADSDRQKGSATS